MKSEKRKIKVVCQEGCHVKECPCDDKDEGDEEEGEECPFQFALLTFVEVLLAE